MKNSTMAMIPIISKSPSPHSHPMMKSSGSSKKTGSNENLYDIFSPRDMSRETKQKGKMAFEKYSAKDMSNQNNHYSVSSINDIIKLYFEIYIIPNTDKLLTVFDLKELTSLLFSYNTNPSIQDENILSILHVLKKILSGNLTCKDRLMSSLLSLRTTIEITELNTIISFSVTMLMQDYLNSSFLEVVNNENISAPINCETRRDSLKFT